MKSASFLLLVFCALMWSCSSGDVNIENIKEEAEEAVEQEEQIKVDPEILEQIIQSIPSPLEISFLIKEVGGEYNREYLNPTSQTPNYTTSYDQALNLGVYGANLAYTNIYENKADGAMYLVAVRNMAKELSIEQFFDVQTLSRLIDNNQNLDSLLMITTTNFEKINANFQKQNQSELSILLLAGGWVEGLNLLCQVNKNNPNDDLTERIGEQKIVLEQLLQLVGYYVKKEQIKVLHDGLSKLNKVYDKVTIEVVEGEQTMEEVDGMMMIVDNSYSKVIMTPQQLEEITNITSDIRNKIIK